MSEEHTHTSHELHSLGEQVAAHEQQPGNLFPGDFVSWVMPILVCLITIGLLIYFA